MEAQDPLSELADIHLPGAVNLWPPAFGWWILALLLLLGLIYCVHSYIILAIRRKRLSFAIKELEQVYQTFSEQVLFDASRNQAGLKFLNQTNAILKRVALLLSPVNSNIAILSGSAWLAYLDAGNSGKEFSNGAGKALGDGIYQRDFNADGDALYALARRWIEKSYKDESSKKQLPLGQNKSNGAAT